MPATELLRAPEGSQKVTSLVRWIKASVAPPCSHLASRLLLQWLLDLRLFLPGSERITGAVSAGAKIPQ
jgi:hypothetical protein